MKIRVGLWLVAAAFIYFSTFFDVDYGYSLDEVIGGVALLVGMILLLVGWMELEEDRRMVANRIAENRHWQEREEAWKDGRP